MALAGYRVDRETIHKAVQTLGEVPFGEELERALAEACDHYLEHKAQPTAHVRRADIVKRLGELAADARKLRATLDALSGPSDNPIGSEAAFYLRLAGVIPFFLKEMQLFMKGLTTLQRCAERAIGQAVADVNSPLLTSLHLEMTKTKRTMVVARRD